MRLRQYQQDALDSLEGYLDMRDGNPLLELPTGAGKSVIQAEIVKRAVTRKERVLCLAHVKELLEQNYEAFCRLCPSLAPLAGLYSAGLGKRQAGNKIVFAGIQSVYKRAKQLGRRDTIIIDECHLVPKKGNGMYRQFLDEAQTAGVRVIGLTATPYRTSSGFLTAGEGKIFDCVAYSVDINRLLQERWLSPLTSVQSDTGYDVGQVRSSGGEFVQKALAEAIEAQKEITARAVEEIRKTAEAQDRKSCLLFCASVAQAEQVYSQLADVVGLEKCHLITGATDSDQRAKAVQKFKAGLIRYMVNVGVFTTGFDAPQVDLIGVLRPTKSPGLWVQICGRGLRKAPGKTNCLVLDFGGNVARHGPINKIQPTLVVPSNRKGVAPTRICGTCRFEFLLAQTVCPNCGAEHPRITKTETVSSHGPIIAEGEEELTEKWCDVSKVVYKRHQKQGKPDSMKVEYFSGMVGVACEYVCLDHPGYASYKARHWVDERLPEGEFAPDTVDQLLQMAEKLLQPVQVLVSLTGAFPRVLEAKWSLTS